MRTKSPPLSDRQFAFVAATAVAAIVPHLGHLPVPLTLLFSLIVVAAWFQRMRTHRVTPALVKLALVAVLPALVVVQYGNVFGREPGAAFACGMLALKLLETATRRDARAVICFSSFVLMSALLFDTGLLFTLALVVPILVLLATLRELETHPDGSAADHAARSPLPSLREAAVSLLIATPLALCAFVFFPRLDAPLWRTPGGDTGRTGMSDTMSPGTIQNLLVDDSPAFRVAFDGARPPAGKLYWRGPVLTDFDGGTWRRRDMPVLAPSEASVQTSGTIVRYEVALEPNDKPWLFALDVPLAAPEGARRTAEFGLIRRAPVTELLRYRVESAIDYRIDAQLSAYQRRVALALPKDFDPRSVALAQGWRRDLGADEAVMRAALALFHDKFFYTLSPPALGRDSIDDFLFSTQRGFCEHYAAAFVFLMRAAGIPARVVTGYQGGYYNSAGDYLLVRQSDAHAWSEVWLAGRGWVRIDPTAAVSPQRIELGAGAAAAAAGASLPWYQSDWVRGLRNQFDLVNRGWNSVIVQFNSLRQQNLLVPLGIPRADYRTLTALLIGTGTLLLLFGALWVMRTPRRRVDALDAAYERLCAKLSRTGVACSPQEGPLDLARRAGDRVARALLADYIGLRYASALPASEDVAGFVRGVRRWRPPASA
ncbi:MAG: DUF3488 and transglutaminase-like domain-containing protein [Rudaea sp.]